MYRTIFLGLLILAALPLAAADLPGEPASEPSANGELIDGAETEVQAEAKVEADLIDLEPIWDKDRINLSCNGFECYQSCLDQYGEGVQSSCVGGTRFGTCVCYP